MKTLNPWIGEMYGKEGNIFGKKLMLVGESHYYEGMSPPPHPIDVDEVNFTVDQVKRQIVGNTVKTFCKFEEIYFGNERVDKRMQFWNSISFYNYVQYIMPDPKYKMKVSAYMIQKSYPAFIDTLNYMNNNNNLPDCIMVCSKTVMDGLPIPSKMANKGINFNVFGPEKNGTYYKSELGDHVIPLSFTRHPSSRGFRCDKERVFHAGFLQELGGRWPGTPVS
ncbi:MAG: hypothetical protein ACYC9V_09090 [Desulfobacteria bacterium]